MNSPVAIVGGGGFGSALARAVRRGGRDAILWSRSGSADADEAVQVTDDFASLTPCELILIAVPSPHVRRLATQAGRHLDGRHLLVHVSRGLEGEELTPLSQVLRDVTPCRRVGVLAGPLIAEALNSGTPSGAIVASPFAEVRDSASQALASSSLRVYQTHDLLGVELASAMIGVLGLAAGIAKGAGGGPASLAIVMARGFAEATRLVKHVGADPESLTGLAGLGDAMAIAAGDDRPELRVGTAIAEGLPIDEAIARGGSPHRGRCPFVSAGPVWGTGRDRPADCDCGSQRAGGQPTGGRSGRGPDAATTKIQMISNR